MLLSVAVFIYIQFHLGLVVSSVTRWIRADFPTKILKFPQFFPTILRIPNLIVKFPKPKKVGFMILNGLEMVAYGA